LTAHPEVNVVSVQSSSVGPGPYALRFPQPRKEPSTPRALVWIGESAGSLLCAVSGDRSVCVRVPATRQIWLDDYLWRSSRRSFAPVVMLGPLAGDRIAFYRLRLPDGAGDAGDTLPFNPRRREDVGPWWTHNLENVVQGDHASAMKRTTTVATVPGPEWLADAGGFYVLTTDRPEFLRLVTRDRESVCLRAQTWTCHPVARPTVDHLHPGLPATDKRLSAQPPFIYRILGLHDERTTTLAVEYHWIRSQTARTPSMEFTGTSVEILELTPDRGFERRASMELMFGRMTLLDRVPTGFLTVSDLSSSRCIDIVEAGGPVPPKMVIAPPGHYCLDDRGSLARQAP
jgi:hypothetical protein